MLAVLAAFVQLISLWPDPIAGRPIAAHGEPQLTLYQMSIGPHTASAMQPTWAPHT